MTKLHISSTFSLPPEAVTETFAILGKRGSGKTSCAVVIVEEMVRAGLPVIVIDPVGVWHGLRASADGKSEGLPVAILGGQHGQVAIEEGSGSAIADFVVEVRQPCVLDLSLFRKNAQTRFMTDFAERLYHAKATHREALHVVVDEADAFCPQRVQPNEARMLGAMEDLVRRGRSRGLGLTLITQRPAVLNKNVLTQAEVLVVFRLAGPQDRAAVDEWVKMHGDAGKLAQLDASIASLPVGTAWFWSPGWLDVFKKVAVRPRSTFDSSATPKAGEAMVVPRVLAPVDLEALKSKIASTIEKAKQEDPKLLREELKKRDARIAELERQAEAMKIWEEPKVIYRVPPVLGERVIDMAITIERLAKFAEDAVRMVKREPSEDSDVCDEADGHALTSKRSPIIVNAPTALRVREQVREERTKNESTQLRAGERRLLDVSARHHPVKLTRAQLATLAGFAATGGTYGTYLSVLRRAGYLEESENLVGVSSTGLAAAGVKARQPMTKAEVLEQWRGVLRAGERTMLDLVLKHRSIHRSLLGEYAGFETSGGTFGTYLSVLRRNGLVDVEGQTVKLGKALSEAK